VSLCVIHGGVNINRVFNANTGHRVHPVERGEVIKNLATSANNLDGIHAVANLVEEFQGPNRSRLGLSPAEDDDSLAEEFLRRFLRPAAGGDGGGTTGGS
jgi:hypothetical protein